MSAAWTSAGQNTPMITLPERTIQRNRHNDRKRNSCFFLWYSGSKAEGATDGNILALFPLA